MSYSTQATTLSITQDKRTAGVLLSDLEAKVRALITTTCMCFKRIVTTPSLDELQSLAIILEGVATQIDQYVRDFPVVQIVPDAIKRRDEFVTEYKLTLEKCQCFQQLIVNSPYFIVLPNEMCRVPAGNAILLSHPIKIDARDQRITALVGQKLGALQVRTQSVELQIIAISQAAWDSLNSVIANYSQISQTHITVYTETRPIYTEATPMLPMRYPRKKKTFSCCSIS